MWLFRAFFKGKEESIMKRGAGILMPISSLPSPYGIGSLGKQAYEFADFLCASKQKYWQILPIGPTGYGDSPYQSFSAFANNPYFIDLDTLCKEKLLTKAEINKADFGDDNLSIDYFKLYKNRKPLLEKAVSRFNLKTKSYLNFVKKNKEWLVDYALFMAIKQENDMVSFTQWDEALRTREPKAIKAAQKHLEKEIVFWQVVQYFFFTQWQNLKSYANKKGIEIIGDIPIYVSPDSSDLWANPELFQVDKKGRLTEVAGCPPDAFSADGQFWGNPLYDWDYHSATDYAWWIKRMQYAFSVYDVVRIDHFRGFEGYYAIAANAKNAKKGRWRMGPGAAFINAIKTKMPNAQIIAEDLGFLTPGVHELLRLSGYPGMKVLQFAFDSREESDYLPHNYEKNSVVYTGTHDNTTTCDWQISAPKADVDFCKKYLNIKKGDDFTRACVRSAMGSVSDVCVIPMADWLALGKKARINTPSTLGENWLWRIEVNRADNKLAKEIAEITMMYGRAKAEVKKASKK